MVLPEEVGAETTTFWPSKTPNSLMALSCRSLSPGIDAAQASMIGCDRLKPPTSDIGGRRRPHPGWEHRRVAWTGLKHGPQRHPIELTAQGRRLPDTHLAGVGLDLPRHVFDKPVEVDLVTLPHFLCALERLEQP
jgi:hypothetical protein